VLVSRLKRLTRLLGQVDGNGKKESVEALIFDTETASLQGGICDIAIAVLDDQLNIVSEVESLIDPERPIQPQAMGIHHITNEMVADAPTLSQFMDMHGYPFKRDDLVLGGHNVGFDIRMIGTTYLPGPFRTIDTLKMARNLWPDLADHKLQTLRYQFNLDAGTAHRAMGDVYACVSLLRMVARDKGIWLQGLLDLGAQPLSLETAFPFGKHKGTKIKNIPTSYVQWLLGNAAELDPSLKEALKLRLA
jgi:exodeoxyribonuclease X